MDSWHGFMMLIRIISFVYNIDTGGEAVLIDLDAGREKGMRGGVSAAGVSGNDTVDFTR